MMKRYNIQDRIGADEAEAAAAKYRKPAAPKAKDPKDMSVPELHAFNLNVQRKIAILESLQTRYPLFRDCQENVDRLEAKIEKLYRGIWTDDSVRAAIQYLSNEGQIIWDKPQPPPQPVIEVPEYDEGPLAEWQLPLDTPDFVLRRNSTTNEQVRDLVSRIHKYDDWKKQNS